MGSFRIQLGAISLACVLFAANIAAAQPPAQTQGSVAADARKAGVDVLRGLGYASTIGFSAAFAPFAFADQFFTTLFAGSGRAALSPSLGAAVAGGVTYGSALAELAVLGLSVPIIPELLAGLGTTAIDTIVCSQHLGSDASLAAYCDRNAKILSQVDGNSGRAGRSLGLAAVALLARWTSGSGHTTPPHSAPPMKPTPSPSESVTPGLPAAAPSIHAGDLVRNAADPTAVRQDLELILRKGGVAPGTIQLGSVQGPAGDRNVVTVVCQGDNSPVVLNVQANAAEWSSTFYLGLRKLGFLFPHPRIQITPTTTAIRAQCGQSFVWKPRFLYRGFHLHTQHPNEWMEGFLEGKTPIADDMVRWLARNQQNILEVVLLKSIDENELSAHLREPYTLAGNFGILRGLDVSFEMDQQQAFRLVNPIHISSLDGLIRSGLAKLEKEFDFDYLSTEVGTTEITGGSYDSALEEIEVARQQLEADGKRLFVKAHVSSNENNSAYGNFNFISQYTRPTVGVQPHTVMLYSLEDSDAPVYGNKNLQYMADFMTGETRLRPTWFFPETSYWCGLDIDVPLFLTDYLRSRASDLDTIQKMGVNGIITFTSGEEDGYWLFDWTAALMVDSDIGSNPWIGLSLLGEDVSVWEKIADFQTQYMKNERMFSILSSSNLIEELPDPFRHPVLARHTMADLRDDPQALHQEIMTLWSALENLPDLSGVRSPELRMLLDVTMARIRHAYWVRIALQYPNQKNSALETAKEVRLAAQAEMAQEIAAFDRYPETSIYDWGLNPTAYEFGYLWPAKTLHYWSREEGMVRDNDYSPLYENIIDPSQF